MLMDRSRYPAHRFPQPPLATRLYRNIAITFLVLTVLVGGVAVWLSSGHAEVRVHVKRDTTTLETTVDVAKSPEQGQLRGRVVDGVFDNIREFTVPESTAVAPTVVATTTGRVRIVNGYSKAQPLIKTTRLLTSDGKLFRINANVTVPAGGSVEVDAYSDKPGSDSLIPKGTTFTIPGLWIDLRKLITGEAVTAFTGSSIATSGKVVTAERVAEAYANLQETVVDQAKSTLAAQAGIPPERLAADCPASEDCWEAVYLVSVTDKKTNVSPGQSSDSFLAQVKATVTGVFYPKKDMQLLVRTKLKERLPDGRDVVGFNPNAVTFTVRETNVKTETARIGISAVATSQLTADTPAFAPTALAGMSAEAVKMQLSSMEGVESVDVTVRPSWVHTIPKQKDKITVTIE